MNTATDTPPDVGASAGLAGASAALCLLGLMLAGVQLHTAGAALAAKPWFAHEVRLGQAAARACERELDDDLAPFEECVFHAERTLASTPPERAQAQRIGLHWQAWSAADLAHRSGAVRGRVVSLAQAEALQAVLPQADPRWNALCATVSVPCHNTRERWAHSLALKD